LYEDNENDLPSALAGAAALATTLHTKFRENPFSPVKIIEGKTKIQYNTDMIKNVSDDKVRTFW